MPILLPDRDRHFVYFLILFNCISHNYISHATISLLYFSKPQIFLLRLCRHDTEGYDHNKKYDRHH